MFVLAVVVAFISDLDRYIYRSKEKLVVYLT